MAYFQSDDIPSCEHIKDCIHTIYRIVVNGVIVKEGRYAIKQTRNLENRKIYRRKYNVSKRCWKDDDWVL